MSESHRIIDGICTTDHSTPDAPTAEPIWKVAPDEPLVTVPLRHLRAVEQYLRFVHYGYFTGPDAARAIKDGAGQPWALISGAMEGKAWKPAVSEDGATYTPWTNGWSVGYHVTFNDDRPAEYLYLNPSGGSDDGVDCAFIYQGTEGDPAIDGSVGIYLNVGQKDEDDGHPDHVDCADACGLAVTHDGACRDKPGGSIVCTIDNHETQDCRRCGRRIVFEQGRWIDPEATGDDAMWRETCDENRDTVTAEHEPEPS
jgi:hypothetical protein